MIIGITGPIGHGKTSLAEAFGKVEKNSKHLESFELIAEIADELHSKLTDAPKHNDLDAINDWLRELPPALKQSTGVECTFQQIRIKENDLSKHPEYYEKLFTHLRNLEANPNLSRQHINSKNKASYRPFLQWLGGYLPIRTQPDLWYRELVRRARVALGNGAKLCILGGVRYPAEASVVQETGGIIIAIVRPDFRQDDLQDLTERERAGIIADSTVINDGSLNNLRSCAKRILDDLNNQKLAQKYSARQS